METPSSTNPDAFADRRPRRRLLRWGLGSLLTLALVLVLLALSLRSSSARRWLLDQVSDRVAEQVAVDVAVEDFDLSWSGRQLTVDGIQVAVPSQTPFLTVERVRIGWYRWRDLLSAPRRLSEVDITAPVLDLDAPRPTGGSQEPKTDEPLGTLGLDIDRLVVTEITLHQTLAGESTSTAALATASADEAATADWLAGWAFRRGAVTGRFENDRLEAQLVNGQVWVEPVADPAIELAVSGAVAGDLTGPYSLQDLQVVGDGLQLAAAGSFDPSPGGAAQATLDLDAEPARWLPSLASGAGRVRAEGTLTLPLPSNPKPTAASLLAGLRGDLMTTAERFPFAMLTPWVGPELVAALGAQGSHLDLDAQLDFLDPPAEASSPGPEVQGQAQLDWVQTDATRGEETWLATSLQVVPDTFPALVVEVDGALLPAVEGQRRLRGTVRLPDWPTVDTATLAPLTLDAAGPDLVGLLAAVAERWPGVATALPASPEALAKTLAGPFALQVDASGRAQDPATEGRLTWNPQGVDPADEGLGLTLNGHPARQDGTLILRGTRLDLARLAPLIPQPPDAASGAGAPPSPAGSVDVEARVDLVGGTPEGTLTLDLASARWSTDLPTLTTGRVEATLVANDGSPPTLSVTARATGSDDQQIRLDATAPFETPLRTARLDLGAERPVPGLASALVQAHLDDGILRLDRARIATDPAEGLPSTVTQVQGQIPLASLGIVPGLGETLAELPVLAQGGPVALTASGTVDGWRVELIEESQSAEGDQSTDQGQASEDGVATTTVEASETTAPDEEVDPELLRPAAAVRVDSRWAASLGFEPGRLGHAQGLATTEQLTLTSDGGSGAPWVAELGGEDGLRIELADGWANVHASRLQGPRGQSSLDLRLPLGSLAEVPGVADALEQALGAAGRRLFDSSPGGPWAVDASFDLADAGALIEWLDLAPVRGLCGQLGLNLQVEPGNPLGGRGDGLIEGLAGQVAQRPLAAVRPLRLAWADGQVELDGEVELGGERLAITGRGDLVEGPTGPTLVDLDFQADGHLPTDLVDPWVEGSAGKGRIALAAQIGGSLEAPVVRATVDGEEATIVLTQPYRTVVRRPQVAVHNATTDDGAMVWHLDRLEAEVNDGSIAAGGRVDTEGLHLNGVFDSLRYQVDYGLNTLTSGNFEIFWPLDNPTETPPQIGANVLVERAVLRRDIPLVRQVLEQLFGPGEVPGLAEPPADDPRLNVSIATVDGVRVRNNLADLRATWNPLQIRGTASQPVISGGVDVESGGLISLYGQVLRLDRAQLTFSGLAGVAPELDLQTTSTLEDPTVGRGRDDLFTDPGSSAEPTDVDQALTTGLASFAGERLSDLASPILGGRTSISVQPVVVFGESDPDARLTVRRDLSSMLALVLAINLRDTQRRTYLVDLHALPALPRFQAQVFTNEDDDAGATVQQTYEFGGGPTAAEGQRRLRNLVFDVPPGLDTKPLRRATRLDTGDLLDDGSDFDVEIDVAEALRRQGRPAATVRVLTRPAGIGQVDLVVTVDPGPRTEIELTGDLPPRALRRTILDRYDPALDRATLHTELSRRTREVFRGLGHPEPTVSVVFEDLPQDGEDGPNGAGSEDDEGLARRVVIHTDAGPKRTLDAPRFEGLEEDDSDLLAALVSTQLERLELSQASPTADRRLLAHLRNLGFPEATIVDRRIDDDRPILVIEAGPRRTLQTIQVTGLPEGAETVRQALPLSAGTPLRSDLFARAVVDVEGGMRELGWADAKVQPVVEPLPGADGATIPFAVELRVEPGPRRHLGTIHVRGESATRPGWIRRLAQLDEGQVLPPREITDARRRLLATGLFSKVQVLTEPGGALPEGMDPKDLEALDIPVDPDGIHDVVLEVEEVPRFRVAAGLRWTTDGGLAVVTDVLDRNLSGRATSIGLRLRYGEDDQAARLYSVIPRFLASRNDLEVFAEVADDATRGRRSEVSVQLSRTLGRDILGRVYGRYRRVEDGLLAADGSFDEADIPFLGIQLARGQQSPAEVVPRGTFWSLDLSASSTELGSPQRFARLFAQIQHHRGVPWGRRWTWSQSLRVGIADAFGEPLLRDLRFFTGGPLSVRGYDDDTLGPQLADDVLPVAGRRNRAAGGEALLVVNQELRFPVWGAISGVVFLDAGNVWTSTDELDTDLSWSTGFGLRSTSPVGLLRLDVGFPIDRRDQDDSLEIGIGFGHVF